MFVADSFLMVNRYTDLFCDVFSFGLMRPIVESLMSFFSSTMLVFYVFFIFSPSFEPTTIETHLDEIQINGGRYKSSSRSQDH